MSGILTLGKLKTLLDRLTAARASNLDNLDAAISTRQAAWGATATQSGRIDANMSSRLSAADFQKLFGVQTAIYSSQADWLLGTSTERPADIVNDYFPSVTPYRIFGIPWSLYNLSAANVWETLYTLTGPGEVNFLLVADFYNTANHTFDIRIVIDGVQVFNRSVTVNTGTSDTYFMIVPVGTLFMSNYATNSPFQISFDHVYFNTSFLVEFRGQGASTNILRAMKYKLF